MLTKSLSATPRRGGAPGNNCSVHVILIEVLSNVKLINSSLQAVALPGRHCCMLDGRTSLFPRPQNQLKLIVLVQNDTKLFSITKLIYCVLGSQE